MNNTYNEAENRKISKFCTLNGFIAVLTATILKLLKIHIVFTGAV